MKNKLEKIQRAFNKQKSYWGFFSKCERAYHAMYEDDTKRRKTPHSLERSRLYVPLIKTTCDIIHSIFKTSFLSSGCPIEVRRVGMRSEHDQILQNTLNALVKKHWQDKSHKVGLSRAVLSAIYLPLGVVQLYWTDGCVRTKHIPIADIAFDTEAADISDVDYIAYEWRQSKVELKSKFESGLYTHQDPHAVAQNEIGRVITKELYERKFENGRTFWLLHTFIAEEKVREAKFDRLPFHFGYCLDAMPPVLRSTELTAKDDMYIGVYGSCLPARVGEIQAEYNIKRNQKIDLIERIIDPQFIICANKGTVNINDIYENKKIIRVETAQGEQVSSLVMPLQPVNSAMSISEEIGVLKDEYERATGVNSIMTGQTSPSDRRAMGALQVVNASSSMRIEAMLQTLADTMLNGYARDFVELIYQNASDEELIAITENPNIISLLGSQAKRANTRLDFDIKTSFGTTISSEMEVNQLNNLLGVLAQTGMSDPKLISPLLKDIMLLLRGENAPIEQIDEAFAQIIAQQEAAAQAQIAEKQAQASVAQAQADEAAAAQAAADPSVVEAAAAQQAAVLAAQNEAQRVAAVENAAYEGGL
nr:hypothetical protein [uncultured Campylobacter sp.]